MFRWHKETLQRKSRDFSLLSKFVTAISYSLKFLESDLTSRLVQCNPG
jgi:hypothetical protein